MKGLVRMSGSDLCIPRNETARPGFFQTKCAAHIGMDGIRIEKEPRQGDEYVYRIS